MMPIGVPRVPYRTPQSGGWQWVDIWNCLVSLSQLLHFLGQLACHAKLGLLHAWGLSWPRRVLLLLT